MALETVEGLRIDDKVATKQSLIARGPEKLVEEILVAIKNEIELPEDQRKN